MKIRGWIRNFILALSVLTVVMLGVEHSSSMAKSCVLTQTASATGENVCAQKLPFESYALSRDSSFGLIREVITTIRSYDGSGFQFGSRFWFNALILSVIYMCLLMNICAIWSSDTYISKNKLRTIRYIHLRDGQK